MTATINPTRLVTEFRCLAADCPDTCCHGWGMQVDAGHVDLYRREAPELLDAVTSGEAEHIMRRDPHTDFCVKYTAGLCAIHGQYGERFLGDACHFYPRATRRLGERAVMSAALSCPEVMRLALEKEEAQALDAATPIDRLPEAVRDYTPKGLSAAEAWEIHQAVMAAGEEAATAEEWLVALHNLSRSLPHLPVESWPQAVPFTLKNGRHPRVPPEAELADAYKLLQTLVILVHAGSASAQARLLPLCEGLAARLDAGLEAGAGRVVLKSDPESVLAGLHAGWQALPNRPQVEQWLKRWLAAQLRLNLFPWAGLGADMLSRLQLTAVKYCLLRLCLRATVPQGPMPLGQVRDIAYNLARYLDHLADPTLFMALITESGWGAEGRLNGLITR